MLTKIHTSIQTSELRKNLSKYLRAAKSSPLVISTERGGGTRVIISSVLYNKLIEAYEDSVDSAELERLVQEDTGGRVTLKALKAKHGL